MVRAQSGVTLQVSMLYGCETKNICHVFAENAAETCRLLTYLLQTKTIASLIHLLHDNVVLSWKQLFIDVTNGQLIFLMVINI